LTHICKFVAEFRAKDFLDTTSRWQIPIVYYSLYGHVFKLAQAVKEGA
jgi:hypothetical protein